MRDAYEYVLEMHNELVVRLMEMVRELQLDGDEGMYAQVLIGFGDAMVECILGSERYRV